MTERTIEQVLADHTGALMALRGVVGVAQGLCVGRPCIRVFVLERAGVARSSIPARIEGFAVSVEPTDEFRI